MTSQNDYIIERLTSRSQSSRLEAYTLIDPSFLVICELLDEGNFGKVYLGGIKRPGKSQEPTIPVAIKEIKQIDLSKESLDDIKNEANVMRQLNHLNIIKFLGVYFGDGDDANSSPKIVLEYAKLGAINKYLKSHKSEMKMSQIVKFCFQISLAMEYLASKLIVHRDLAARNVLLVNEHFCKITDFGMSRILNDEKYYYQSIHKESSMPFKWYPIDLITAMSKRFDEKSDVWSFGVTCWELVSYGSIPYENTNIHNLVYLLENGHRLERPDECPQDLYDLMLKCWSQNREKRGVFSQIVADMKPMIGENDDDDATLIENPSSNYANIDYIYLNEMELTNKKKREKSKSIGFRESKKSNLLEKSRRRQGNDEDIWIRSMFKRFINTRKKLAIFISVFIAIVLVVCLAIVLVVLATTSKYFF